LAVARSSGLQGGFGIPKPRRPFGCGLNFRSPTRPEYTAAAPARKAPFSGEASFKVSRQSFCKVLEEGSLARSFAIVDADGDGCVDFGEFSNLMLRPVVAKYSAKEIENAFLTIQANLGHETDPPDGYIFAETLHRGLAMRLRREDADHAVDALNPDVLGRINYQHIVDVVNGS